MKLNELIPWKRGKHEGSLLERVPSLFDKFVRDPFDLSFPEFSMIDSPKIEVSESKTEVLVRAEIPGMDEKDISVDYFNGALRISGEKHEEKSHKKEGRNYSECSYGRFTRVVPIPKNSDWHNAKAKYKKGVLMITLPKDTTVADNRIEIKVQ